MSKNLLSALFTLFLVMNVTAQNRYFTKNGIVSFEAGTALEDIESVNKSGYSVIDIASGRMEFAVLIKGFEFRRALMQEHFNENYMESDKYPKALFKGTIDNASTSDFNKQSNYSVSIKGVLEIHGVKKEIVIKGSLRPDGSTLVASASFIVNLSDYNISIPSLVKDKISKTVNISISATYKPLNQK